MVKIRFYQGARFSAGLMVKTRFFQSVRISTLRDQPGERAKTGHYQTPRFFRTPACLNGDGNQSEHYDGSIDCHIFSSIDSA